MGEKVPVVLEDGKVEEVDGNVEVTCSYQEKYMPAGFRLVLSKGLLVSYERPSSTAAGGAYAFTLPDGRLCQIEGWRDEALRLRGKLAMEETARWTAADDRDSYRRALNEALESEESLRHQRNALGRAIGEAAMRTGGCREDVDGLTGPQLLLLVKDMADELLVQRECAKKAEAQLEAIDSISERDWMDGEAVTWVYKIRNGEPLDGMVKQEDL